MTLKSELKSFVDFLKYPVFDYKEGEAFSLSMVLKMFAVVFAVELLLFAPISSAIGIEDIPHAMTELLKNKTYLEVFALAVIAAPIAEELIFRFHLKYRSLNYFYVAMVIATIGAMYVIYNQGYSFGMLQSNLENGHVPMTDMKAVLIFFGVLIAVYFLQQYYMRKDEEERYRDYFPFIFYLSAIVFSIIHVSNFGLESERWYLSPLLVMPQFILALYIGYVRLRKGILFAILIHMTNNMIPMLLTLAFPDQLQ